MQAEQQYSFNQDKSSEEEEGEEKDACQQAKNNLSFVILAEGEPNSPHLVKQRIRDRSSNHYYDLPCNKTIQTKP